MNRRSFVTVAVAALAAPGALPAAPQRRRRFYAPAEESPHARTWMCWPSTPAIYGGPGRYFEGLQEELAQLAAAIAEHEPVTMLAARRHHQLAAELCGPGVDLLDVPTDDMWARDSGPVFLRDGDGRPAVLDLNFNGWGGRQRHRRDGRVARAIADHTGYRYFRADVVGEGGGLEVDGEGTLLLTDSCWVNDHRNPGMTRDEIEAALKEGLGLEKVIWLPGVRDQDITDGHIDGAIRVVRPGLLMTGSPADETSDFALALAESKEILSRTTDARGRAFEIVDIPNAVDVRSRYEGFFSGYANYYVGNGAVYTPTFGDTAADKLAVETLGELFPDRRIVTLELDRIYESGGGIHCVTQQEPVAATA